MQIREATVGDIDALCDLFVEVNDLHVEAVPHLYQKVEADEVMADYLRDQIGWPGRQIFVAEQAGMVAGFVIVAVRLAPDAPVYVRRRFAEIEVLTVRTSSRRQGIGRALMDRAHQWAADRDIDQVELVVLDFNDDARRFYEELGYLTLNRRMRRSMGKTDQERKQPIESE
jgi:ribosomal protein S18 acetylase RimI-like enzyme